MRDAMDLENAKAFVRRVEAGEVRLAVTRGGRLPSPFAFNLVAVGATDVVMMEDRKVLIRKMHERVMALLAEREGAPAAAPPPGPEPAAGRPPRSKAARRLAMEKVAAKVKRHNAAKGKVRRARK
jgi:hypothetical protein